RDPVSSALWLRDRPAALLEIPNGKAVASGMRDRRRKRAMVSVLAAVLGVVTGDAAAQSPASGGAAVRSEAEPALRPFHLNFRRFEIPFSVDALGQRPVEVQLYVSRDAGSQWELYATQAVSGKPFLFESA